MTVAAIDPPPAADHLPTRRQSGLRGRNQRRGREKKHDEVAPVHVLWKTRLCSFHASGLCRRGAACGFAHGDEDLRPSPDFERTSVCPHWLNSGECKVVGCRYAHSGEELRKQPGLLKTRMCSFFLSGGCVVGEACRFAHSMEELHEAAEVQRSQREGKASAEQSVSAKEQRRAAFAAPSDGREREPTEEPAAEESHEEPAAGESPAPGSPSGPVEPTALADAAGEMRTGSSATSPWCQSVPQSPEVFPVHHRASVVLEQGAGPGPENRRRVVRSRGQLAVRVCVDDLEDIEDIVLPTACTHREHATSTGCAAVCAKLATCSQKPEPAVVDTNTGKVLLVTGCDIDLMSDTPKPGGLEEGDCERSGEVKIAEGCCGRSSADCAVCTHRGPCAAGSRRPCAACDCGLRVVCRNTFLTIDEEAGVERQCSNMRRSRSLSL